MDVLSNGATVQIRPLAQMPVGGRNPNESDDFSGSCKRAIWHACKISLQGNLLILCGVARKYHLAT